MIQVGDIVQYQYRGNDGMPFYGIVVRIDNNNDDDCWVDWFNLGIEKARKSFLKVLTQ